MITFACLAIAALALAIAYNAHKANRSYLNS